jgi:NitT/TauT family transport system permease protein
VTGSPEPTRPPTGSPAARTDFHARSTRFLIPAGRRGDLLVGLMALIAFLLGWQALVVVSGLPPYILPAPAQVGARLIQAWTDGTMWRHAQYTIFEIVLGFVVGGTLAVVAGYALARSRLVERALSPYLVAAQATPVLALAPLLALWFGTGILAKVIVCALIVFFPVAIVTMVGVRSVDPRLVEMMRSLRATRGQTIRVLEVPSALPSIFGGLRIGITLAVIGAIVGEWAGGDRGLGVLLNLARGGLFDIPLLFATLVTIAAVALVLYALVVLAERQLVGAR